MPKQAGASFWHSGRLVLGLAVLLSARLVVSFSSERSCCRCPSRTVRVAAAAAPSQYGDASSANTWRSEISTLPAGGDAVAAVRDLCSSIPSLANKGESALAFLFVASKLGRDFDDIVRAASETLGEDTILLSVVGGGVVGGGVESDDPMASAMSLLHGILPPTAGVEVFMFGPDEAPPPAASEAWKAIGRNQEVPSYVVFADPWAPLPKVLEGLDGSGERGAIVAGGLSCPIFGEDDATVAINGKSYPRGSAVGVGLSGSLGLQVVVAQGCRPVGPTFAVTEGEENQVIELDSKPAVEQLAKFTESLSEKDKALIDANGVMCGLAAPGSSSVEEGDYLIRQIMGLMLPSILIGAEVKRGDVLRFHVRDSDAAREDLQNMIGRARTERMFAGSQRAGVPLAALQISCVARGRTLFGNSNVDLSNLKELVGEQSSEGENNSAVAGFFANGEIGPVGIAGVGLGGAKQTHMHGFTTVAAVLCDFSGAADSSSPADASTPPDTDGQDVSAWE